MSASSLFVPRVGGAYGDSASLGPVYQRMHLTIREQCDSKGLVKFMDKLKYQIHQKNMCNFSSFKCRFRP
jgi:hypothetical protein